MKKTLLEVYALVGCFASMIFLLVSGAVCLYEFLRIVEPSVTLNSYEYEQSTSDEQFLRSWPQSRPTPEPSTISQLRRDAFERALRSERHNGLRSLLQSLMYTIAAGLVYWLHWRLAQQEREKTAVVGLSST